MKKFNALFFRKFANKQSSVFFGHDISVQALYNHFLLASGMDDAVVRFVEVDVRPDAGVAVSVLLHLLAQRAPRAEVAPAETGGIDEDLLCVLHNGIVHRDMLTSGEELVNHLLLLRRVVDGQQIFEDARHGGLVHAERVDNRADVPNKDA